MQLDNATLSTLNNFGKPKIQSYVASFKLLQNFILRYDCIGIYADFENINQRLIDIKSFPGLQLLDCASPIDRYFCYITSENCSYNTKLAINQILEELKIFS